MRKSLEELIETMYKVKTHLSEAKYELYDFDDGARADIKVKKISYPKTLRSIIGHLEYEIIHENDAIRITVFENFNEYT